LVVVSLLRWAAMLLTNVFNVASAASAAVAV
jgi:hypothetical protein